MSPKQFDEWRVIPRILVFGYGVALWRISEWFMLLPAPNGAQAAFVSTVVGAAAAFFGFYVNSGKSNADM